MGLAKDIQNSNWVIAILKYNPVVPFTKNLWVVFHFAKFKTPLGKIFLSSYILKQTFEYKQWISSSEQQYSLK